MAISIIDHVIIHETRRDPSELRIELWDRTETLSAWIDSAATDTEGVISVELDEHVPEINFLLSQAELFFKVFWEDNLIESTKDSLVWRADNLSEITIEVNDPHYDEEQERNKTGGKQPREARNLPISDLTHEFQMQLPRTLSTSLREHQITILTDIHVTGGSQGFQTSAG